MDFAERTDSIDVPKNTGVPGLLKMISALLTEIPRVKEISIRNTGRVEYTWYAPAEGQEPKVLEVQFEALLPYAIIRNTTLREVAAGTPAHLALISLFNTCHSDRLYPICLVTGTQSKLWDWMKDAVGVVAIPSDTLFGYPLLQDKAVPDDVLILCASYARTTHISDTFCSYKLTMETPSHGK